MQKLPLAIHQSILSASLVALSGLTGVTIAGPVFDIHGQARNCRDILGLDQALDSSDTSYFAGWEAKDFAKAEDWAEQCKTVGSRKIAAARADRIAVAEADVATDKALANLKAPSAPAGAPPLRSQAVDIAANARAVADKLTAENAAATSDAPPSNDAPARSRPSPSAAAPANALRPNPDQSTLTEQGHDTNTDGNSIHSPNDVHVPSGATAQCADGSYSFSQNRRGTCLQHGGVATWLE